MTQTIIFVITTLVLIFISYQIGRLRGIFILYAFLRKRKLVDMKKMNELIIKNK